jgi:4-amino-4-deoxy-L-arabinose transferase-like glycosyltransferase
MISRLTRGSSLYLFIFVVYSIGLWKISVPLTGDQKTYLSIALEMRERSEWITPYLFNAANFLKPPFQYWATLIGWKVFGFNLVGALLPSVLALVGSAFLVSRLTEFIFQKKNGALSALIFAGTLGTMTYGTTSQMEIWIVLFYLLAWERWLSGKIWTALITVGVMAWIKGPLYPALWVLSTWVWVVLEKRVEIFKQKKYWFAVIGGILIGLSWYFLAAQTHLPEMKQVFFLRENLGKIQTTQGSPGKLWGDFLFSLFPQLFLFLLLLGNGGLKFWRNLASAQKNFLIAYALLPALFFTLFPYRVGTYLYLLTPVVSWVIVQAIATTEIKKFSRSLLGVLTSVISILLCFLAYRLAQGNWIGFEIAFPLMVVLGLWAYAFWKLNFRVIALCGLLIVNLIRMGAVEIGEKDLMGLRNYLNDHPGNIAYLIEDQDIWHEFGYFSTALSQDIDRLDLAQVDDYLKIGGSLILSDVQIDQRRAAIQAQVDWVCTPWPRLKRRTKFPLRELVMDGLSVEDEKMLRNYQICRSSLSAQK